MTALKGGARDIDNSRLNVIQGTAFIPALGTHVHWEGYGERALLLLRSRDKGLQRILSQPERIPIVVGGRRTTYCPDYRFDYAHQPSAMWEAKGAWALADPKVQAKLRAAEAHYASQGKTFRVLNSTIACRSEELRNVELLRPYARVDVDDDVKDWLLAALRLAEGLPVAQLGEVAASESVGRRSIYALMYRGDIQFDWTRLLRESTVLKA
jgi:hypothetical protein